VQLCNCKLPLRLWQPSRPSTANIWNCVRKRLETLEQLRPLEIRVSSVWQRMISGDSTGAPSELSRNPRWNAQWSHLGSASTTERGKTIFTSDLRAMARHSRSLRSILLKHVGPRSRRTSNSIFRQYLPGLHPIIRQELRATDTDCLCRFSFTVPAQPVDATLSNQLIHKCLP
jgi:hypothetical protein